MSPCNTYSTDQLWVVVDAAMPWPALALLAVSARVQGIPCKANAIGHKPTCVPAPREPCRTLSSCANFTSQQPFIDLKFAVDALLSLC
eukprot:6189768-Pleurochrysis_carterae.AAC.1